MAAAKAAGVNLFKARNNNQVYKARDLTRALAEYFSLKCYFGRVNRGDTQAELKPTLHRIALIYGLWCIDKHLGTFYQGGFTNGTTFADVIRNELLIQCGLFKNDAVSVADAIAPPDWVLNSVIGKSNGKVRIKKP